MSFPVSCGTTGVQFLMSVGNMDSSQGLWSHASLSLQMRQIYQCKHFLEVEASGLEVLEIVYSGDLSICIC